MKKTYILGIVSAITWSLSAILISSIYNFEPFKNHITNTNVSGLIISFLSEMFGLVTIAIFILLRKNKVKLIKSDEGKKYIAIGALFSGPIGMSLYYIAIKYVGQSVTDAITGIYPVIIILVSIIFLKHRYNFKVYFGMLLTLIGLQIILYSAITGTINLYGVILSFITGLSWSMEALILDKTTMDKNISWTTSIFMRQLTTTIGYLVIVMIFLKIFFDSNVYQYLQQIFFNPKLLLIIIINGIFVATSYATFYFAITLSGSSIPAILNVTYMAWTPILTLGVGPILNKLGILVSMSNLTTPFFIALPLLIIGVMFVILFSNKSKN